MGCFHRTKLFIKKMICSQILFIPTYVGTVRCPCDICKFSKNVVLVKISHYICGSHPNQCFKMRCHLVKIYFE